MLEVYGQEKLVNSWIGLPVQPMEHHYLITNIPEVEAMGDQRLPIGTDFEEIYILDKKAKECCLEPMNKISMESRRYANEFCVNF